MPLNVPRRVFAIVTLLVFAGCAVHRGAESSATPDVTHGADLERGKIVYQQQCQACHGAGGVNGPVGPALHRERARRGFESVRAIVLDPDPPMPKLYPSRITAKDARDVAAFVESL